jgi:hypothetical protein
MVIDVPAIPYRSKRKQAFFRTGADLPEESLAGISFNDSFSVMFHDNHTDAGFDGLQIDSVFSE